MLRDSGKLKSEADDSDPAFVGCRQRAGNRGGRCLQILCRRFWLPGIYGSLAAVPQEPGWSFAAINYYDSVSASGCVAAAREITIGKLSPTVNVSLNVSVNERIFLIVAAAISVF